MVSFLIKMQVLRTAILLKSDPNMRFSVKFAMFLRTPIFTEHLLWLFLTVLCFQPTTSLEMRPQQTCFSVNFAKVLRISFDRIPFICETIL